MDLLYAIPKKESRHVKYSKEADKERQERERERERERESGGEKWPPR